jgi:cell division protein FtsB
VTPGRWAILAGLAFALYFALQGGEYGTLDLLQLRRETREERENVARLQRMVDSLTAVALGIEKDPRVQERVARERFGMLKKGEFLYRLVPTEQQRERDNDSVSGKR